jgi:small subunit ribosomal protein S16
VEFNEERLNYWLKTGATPSETVADLIKVAAKAKTAAPAV